MATKQDISRRIDIQSALVGIVIAAAMFAGFYMFYYTPSNKKVESIRRKVEVDEQTLRTVRTQAPLLKPMTEKVKWLEQQLKVFRAKIAEKGEVVSLIRTIEKEAQRLGLEVRNMHSKTVEPPAPSEDKSSSGDKDVPPVQPAYNKVILDMHMHADYYKLEGFLATIQNLKSFIVIESIDINTKEEEIAPEMALSLEISLYSKIGDDNAYVVKKE